MNTNKLLTLLLLFAALGFSQSKQEIEIKNLYWGDNDSQKNNADVPSNWENESAVILYQEYFYDYHKYAKNVKYTHAIRKRVKLLDNAAIKEYSEFSFIKKFRVNKGYGKNGKKFLGIKIIKPNGDEKEIEIDKEAVETDTNNEYKLAISGLEVGDIIDYYIHTIEPFKQKYGYTFKSIERPLIDIYPTKEFVLRFNTENDFFINFNTYNGAPKLKQIQTEKRNDRRYELRASNLKKSDYPIWFNPYQELPFFKFQVTFARKGSYENQIFNFLSDDEKTIKEKVSKEDVLELFDNEYGKFSSKPTKTTKSFGETTNSNEELLEKAYYYMRHNSRNKFIQPSIIRESKINYDAFSYYKNSSVFMNSDKYFNASFTSLLIEYEIPFDIIVSKNRTGGNIEDLLFSSEVNTLIRINLETPIYISLFDTHSLISDINPLIENSKAYALSYSYDDRRLNAVNEFIIPTSSYKDNESFEKLNVSLNDDMSGIKIDRTSSYKGHNKTSIQKNLLYFFDIIGEDNIMHKTKNYFERVKKKKEKEKTQKEYNALVEKLKKRQIEQFNAHVKDEYELDIKNHSFEIINTGRYSNHPSFVFSDQFEINDALIKKAGPNYILEIGKLIGDQVNITDKERHRKENIYFNNPRCYRNEIKFEIPSGYTVTGLDKLNKSVDNPTGAFISTAKIKDNTLIINTYKAYKNNYESNSNWNLILDFLDAANQFTNEKILLKKGKSIDQKVATKD